MATEFVSDAAELLIIAMREAGIGPEVCGKVAQQWQDSVVRNWAGDRVYIGSNPAQVQRARTRRDAAIVRDWMAGERLAALSRKYGITRQRAYQIVRDSLGEAQLSSALP